MKTEAELIVDHIKASGGTISAAARELEIKLTKQIRTELEEIDNNLERYRYAFKRHGNWFTLPTNKADTRDAQKLDSICLCCNKIHSVSLIGLVSGRSTGCHSCRMKERENIEVTCKKSGKTFSSIREFAASVGRDKQYQGIRHKLKSQGTIVIDDMEYSLN